MQRRKFILMTITASSAIILSSCFKQSPGKRVSNFLRLLEKGEIDEAVTFFSRGVIQLMGESKVRLALIQGTKDIKKRGGIQYFKINQENINGDIAKVNYTVKYKNETEESNDIQLIKEDDEWKIDITK